ncbi:MAG: hypothetical protein EP332_05110 [Bacteroidetes bacterium]|nr:MAG: hypothetical protein EP332_05110 [Bacteroidota bacterium]
MKVKLLPLIFLGTFLNFYTESSAQVKLSVNSGLAVNYGPPSTRTISVSYWQYAPQVALQAKIKSLRLELGLGDFKHQRYSYYGGDPECGMGNTTPYQRSFQSFRSYFEVGLSILKHHRHNIEWVNGVNYTRTNEEVLVVYEAPGSLVQESKEKILAWHTGLRYSFQLTKRIQPLLQLDYAPVSSGVMGTSSWINSYSEEWNTQQLRRELHAFVGLSISLN